MRLLSVLLLLFTLCAAHGRTLGDAGDAQIEIPDTWRSYQELWVSPDQTIWLEFRSLGRKGDPARFAESVRAQLVQKLGEKLLTDTQLRGLGDCQVASWKSMSKLNYLTLNYMIGKNGNMASLTLTVVKTPSDGALDSLESQLLSSLRWP